MQIVLNDTSNKQVYNIRKSLLTFIRENESPKELFRDACGEPQVYFNLNTIRLSNNESWKIVSIKSSQSKNKNESNNEINKEVIRERHPKVHHKPNIRAQSSSNIDNIIQKQTNKAYNELKTISPQSALKVIRRLAIDRLTLRSASPKLSQSNNALCPRDVNPIKISTRLHQRIRRKRSNENLIPENFSLNVEKYEHPLIFNGLKVPKKDDIFSGCGH